MNITMDDIKARYNLFKRDVSFDDFFSKMIGPGLTKQPDGSFLLDEHWISQSIWNVVLAQTNQANYEKALQALRKEILFQQIVEQSKKLGIHEKIMGNK